MFQVNCLKLSARQLHQSRSRCLVPDPVLVASESLHTNSVNFLMAFSFSSFPFAYRLCYVKTPRTSDTSFTQRRSADSLSIGFWNEIRIRILVFTRILGLQLSLYCGTLHVSAKLALLQLALRIMSPWISRPLEHPETQYAGFKVSEVEHSRSCISRRSKRFRITLCAVLFIIAITLGADLSVGLSQGSGSNSGNSALSTPALLLLNINLTTDSFWQPPTEAT
jgi:hypothetical protein